MQNAPGNAAALGCEAFQIFSRSPQGGPAPKLTGEVLAAFRAAMDEHGYRQFVIHAPYYINFGSGKPATYQASIRVIREELERGTSLGAAYLMFHPGSGKDLGSEAALKQARGGIKKVLDGYAGSCKLLIENAAGAGEILGDTFEEVALLAEPILEHPGFGGVCLDTQHSFASGYDLRSAAAVAETMKKFDAAVGLRYLACVHANDSKPGLGERKDRHDHVGSGQIGEGGFSAILKFLQKKKMDVPVILETEHDLVKKDIAALKRLRG